MRISNLKEGPRQSPCEEHSPVIQHSRTAARARETGREARHHTATRIRHLIRVLEAQMAGLLSVPLTAHSGSAHSDRTPTRNRTPLLAEYTRSLPVYAATWVELNLTLLATRTRVPVGKDGTRADLLRRSKTGKE